MLDGGEDTAERNNQVPDPADTNPADGQDMIAASEDWAAYRGAMAAADGTGVTLDLNTGAGTAGEAMGDTLRNIELYWGSKHGDTFIAGAGADVIHGDGGSDTVSYEASRHGVIVALPTSDDATQFSTNGPDGVAGGGDDTTESTFTPASEADVAAWRGGTATRPAAVQADDNSTTTKSYAEGDILESIENVTGSRDDDQITGDAVPNVIKGGGGNDKLNGGAEDDKLYGGEGNDMLGNVDVDGDGTAEAEGGDDTLMGGPGNDTLNGGADDDTLDGGVGDDDLTGGVGNDTFVFNMDNGSDIILGFEAGDAGADLSTDGSGDKIDLSAFNIDDDELAGLLSDRASNVIVNLEDYGGGRITIQGTTKAALTARGLIHNDLNGDTAGVGDDVNGVAGNDGSDGVFII